jgi:hypothetical protein
MLRDLDKELQEAEAKLIESGKPLLEALANGPKTIPELSEAIGRGQSPFSLGCTGSVLRCLEKNGLVTHDDEWRWSLK